MKDTFISVLTAAIFFCSTGLAYSAERSVIVGFHQKPGPAEQALIHGARGILKRTFDLIPAMVVRFPEEEIGALKQSSRVAYIDENATFTAVEPLASDEYVNSWGVYRIFSDVAHASGNRGAGVDVAVLDTGIDYDHPDLKGHYSGGYDFVSDDSDPYESYNIHGTHVAGIIAAEGNGIGVIGVAPEANIYAVRILDSAGIGTLSWVISGIEWAVKNGMDIVNMSLEGMHFESLEAACDAAYESGVLLVAAAGNLSKAVKYPAAYGSVIAVTGTDAYDMQAFPPNSPEVELAAPGVDILSTCIHSNEVCANNGGYQLLSGTSQAAPHVSGVAALLFGSVGDVNDDGIIDNVDVRQELWGTAEDLGLDGRDDAFGFGLVNAAAASFHTDISLSVIKSAGPPHRDSELVRMDGAPYEIHIVNNGLVKVAVEVFEEEAFVRELSAEYFFNISTQQEVVFVLDATGKRYDVQFTPYGRPGKSMNIMISMQGGQN